MTNLALSPLAVATNLIKSYCDSGRLSDARRVFDELPVPDVVAWTTMICGYVSNARSQDTWDTFRAMNACGVDPNAFTLSSVLTACKVMEFARYTASVHVVVVRQGIYGQMHVDNGLVDAYSAYPSGITDALKVFDGISQRSAASWTTKIAAYVRRGNGGAAVQMCCRMFQGVFLPHNICGSQQQEMITGFQSLSWQMHQQQNMQ